MKKDINNYGEILASIDSCTQNFFAWYFWQNLLYILAPDWLRIERSIARSTYDRPFYYYLQGRNRKKNLGATSQNAQMEPYLRKIS